MMIPFGTDRPLHRPTVITYWLIALCIGMFLLKVFWSRFDPKVYEGFEDALVLDPQRFSFINLFTYQFLHADVWHLVGNMLFLLVFGPNVEDRLKRWGFLPFYLLGGAIAGGAHCLLEEPVFVNEVVSIIPGAVGASGSIAAVTGAYMILFPLTNIRVVLFFIIIGTFNIPAWIMIVLAIGKDIFLQAAGGGDVAHIAHLGGYAWGIAVSLVLLATRVVPRETYDAFSMMRQAYRRRRFKELATSKAGAPWRAEAPAAIAASTKPPDERETKIAELRAQVHRLHSQGNLDQACEEYVRLVGMTGDTAMHRTAQLDLANHFFARAKHQHADAAYEAFLKRHPADTQVGHVRLMLALINARYLNDPVRAKGFLRELREGDLAGPHKDLAETLRAELG